MLENIKKYRNNQKTIEDIIQNKMENMSNYKAAIDFIKENGVNSIDEFSIIDMGRKGTKGCFNALFIPNIGINMVEHINTTSFVCRNM